MESVDTLNQRLADIFGIDTVTRNPMWRIVFSDDQFEKRLTKFTASGLELLHPMVVELPKYKQWIQAKYVLENLVLVPEMNQTELAGIKISYEPLWVFQDDKGNALPPKWEACEFIIQQIQVAKGRKFDAAKYKEDPERAMKELARIEEQLSGNETDVTDALAYGEGVVVPSNYNSDKVN